MQKPKFGDQSHYSPGTTPELGGEEGVVVGRRRPAEELAGALGGEVAMATAGVAPELRVRCPAMACGGPGRC